MNKFVSWVEIPATDFERAVNFYNTVFELDLTPQDFGTEKLACFPDDEGAISFTPYFIPSNEGVLVTLNCGDSMDEVLEKISQNGGSIRKPKTKIDAIGCGYFALFLDSEGNQLGLYGK